MDGLPKRVSVTSTECSVSGPLIQLNPTASIPDHAIEAPPGRTAETHEADAGNAIATRPSQAVLPREGNAGIYEADSSGRPAALQGTDKNLLPLEVDRTNMGGLSGRARSM